jgi:hypothetical protein
MVVLIEISELVHDAGEVSDLWCHMILQLVEVVEFSLTLAIGAGDDLVDWAFVVDWTLVLLVGLSHLSVENLVMVDLVVVDWLKSVSWSIEWLWLLVSLSLVLWLSELLSLVLWLLLVLLVLWYLLVLLVLWLLVLLEWLLVVCLLLLEALLVDVVWDVVVGVVSSVVNSTINWVWFDVDGGNFGTELPVLAFSCGLDPLYFELVHSLLTNTFFPHIVDGIFHEDFLLVFMWAG